MLTSLPCHAEARGNTEGTIKSGDRNLLRQLFKTDVPVVGLSELCCCDRQDADKLTKELMQALTEAAAKHFDVKFDC